MKLHKGKSKRKLLFAGITAGSVLVLLVLNLILSHLTLFKAFYIDLTPEELYTATDLLIDELEFVDEKGKTDGDKEVKITFCQSPDKLVANDDIRVTYFLALKLQNKLKNLNVECIDVNKEPLALSKYQVTSYSKINPYDIIVSYGDRYRKAGASNFWTTDYFSYDGERLMASLIRSVTSQDEPKAYFVSDCGAEYYDKANPTSDMSKSYSALYDVLVSGGLKVETISLYDENIAEIPDDCAMLFILNPKSDFESDESKYNDITYVSPIEKVELYLTKNQGAAIVTRDYRTEPGVLKNYDDFLHEWGFDFSTSIVRDNENSVAGADGELDPTKIEIEYDTDENSAASVIYGDFASLLSAPSTFVPNSGYISCAYGNLVQKNESGSMIVTRTYQPFFTTYDTANAYTGYIKGENGEIIGKDYINSTDADGEKRKMDLASICVRENFNTVSSEYTYSYLFASASVDLFKNLTLGDDSYANREITAALIESMSKIDDFASLDLGGSSMNSKRFGGKQLISTVLKEVSELIYGQDKDGKIVAKRTCYGIKLPMKIVFTVFVSAVPVAILVFGIITIVKRKYL